MAPSAWDRSAGALSTRRTKRPIRYFHLKGSPANPTDFFWTAIWIIPSAYPNGTFVYKATATDAQGQTATWEPFKRVTSQLQVVPGEIEIKKP
jgi:hypothetical protein